MSEAGCLQRFLATLGVVALLVVLAATPVALGYIGQAPVWIALAGPPGAVPCDSDAEIAATVIGTATGTPVAQQVVRWQLTGAVSEDDALDQSQAITDAEGRTSVRLSFGDQPGVREVTARVTIVTTTIQVMCGNGLPQTSLAAPDDPGDRSGDVMARPATPTDPELPALSVRIPRLGIVAPIREGDGMDAPTDAVAHYPGTAWPGQGSNAYLYGHARDGLFGELWQARTGDLVEVELADGTIEAYRVTEVRPLVAWDDLTQLDPGPGERLTLQTCLWYDLTSPRLVVIAEPMVAGA